MWKDKMVKNAKKKTPKEVIESIRHPHLESAYVKFPGQEMKGVSSWREPTSVVPHPELVEAWKGIFNQKKYTEVHTHPGTSPIPMPNDLLHFLENNDAKTTVIASTDGKTGAVKAYTVVKKTKKTPIDFDYDGMRLGDHPTEEAYEIFNGRSNELYDYSKELKKVQNTGDVEKVMKEFLDKNHLKYKIIPHKGYEVEKGTMKVKEKSLEGKASLSLILGAMGLIASLFFVSLNLTGNVIGNLGGGNSLGIGFVFLFFALVCAYIYFRK
jgi:proteasome lid subunit RPN8/RPN11